MNTLPRAITARFFPGSDSYNALRKHWSDLMNSERKHELSAEHHLLYLALIGKDWRKAFTALTNKRKLDNGAFWGWGMFRALQRVQFRLQEQDLLAPFDGLITSQTLNELRDLLPKANAYGFTPSDFERGAFPFDAYSVNDNVNPIIHLKKEDSNA